MKKTKNFLLNPKFIKVYFSALGVLSVSLLFCGIHFADLFTGLIMSHAVVIPATLTSSKPNIIAGAGAGSISTSVQAAQTNSQNTKVTTAVQNSSTGIILPQSDHTFESLSDANKANVWALPAVFNVIITGTPTASATATQIYLGNPSIFAPVTEANGTSSTNIAYAWSDGNDGLTLERYMFLGRAGIGAIIYGVQIRLDNILSDGTISPDAIGLDAMTPAFGAWDAFGNFIPQEFVSSANQTRKDQDTSLWATRCVANWSGTTQFRFTMPFYGTVSADRAVVTFYTNPNFSI